MTLDCVDDAPALPLLLPDDTLLLVRPLDDAPAMRIIRLWFDGYVEPVVYAARAELFVRLAAQIDAPLASGERDLVSVLRACDAGIVLCLVALATGLPSRVAVSGGTPAPIRRRPADSLANVA